MSTHPTIHQPRPTRLALVGLAAGTALLAWPACVGAYTAHLTAELPREIGSLLLGVAVTVTLLTGQLWHTYSTQRAEARNAACLAEAIGQVARDVEQVSEKVSRIDPWAIYTAVAEDFGRKDH